MKYNIGDTVGVTLKITGIQVCKNGEVTYQVNNGTQKTESELDRITLNGRPVRVDKPVQDKPVYKVGDKVQIVSSRGPWWNLEGKMDKWFGKIVTLKKHKGGGDWSIEEDQNENYGTGWSWDEADFTPYTAPTPSKPTNDKPDKVMLYCIKSAADHITKGKVYELRGNLEFGSITFDNGWTDNTFIYERAYWDAEKKAKNCLIPLVKRPAKVGEWVYVPDSDGHSYPLNTIGKVTHVTKEPLGWVRLDGDRYSTVRLDEYLVLDGYTPEPEYEWVDGYKGFDADLKCRGFQYNIGGGVSLGEDESESECSKGFHFCKTLDDVYKHYADNGTNRFCKVRGYVKKGYNYTDKYCARKLEVVEEVTKPKGWSGNAVCACTGFRGFTKGKTYTFVNGKTVDDEWVTRPDDASSQSKVMKITDYWFASKFVPLID